jgi:CRP-like cAMP-binding protein
MSIYAYQALKGLGLSEPRVLRLLPVVRSKTFEIDDIIWSKGDLQQPWSHVVTGLMSASLPEQDGGSTPVNIYGPGTWFGEAAILNNQASQLEYVCLAPLRVLSFPLSDAQDAFENEPEFSRYVARLISWRDQQHSEMLALMKTGGPQLRVVMGLALIAEALNSSSSHLPTSGLSEFLDIPLKQKLLSSMFGVSRGVFSVCLQQLAAAGWLNVNYATLRLMRIRTWRSFASTHRNNRLNIAKPSMQELLPLMDEASVI